MISYHNSIVLSPYLRILYVFETNANEFDNHNIYYKLSYRSHVNVNECNICLVHINEFYRLIENTVHI